MKTPKRNLTGQDNGTYKIEPGLTRVGHQNKLIIAGDPLWVPNSPGFRSNNSNDWWYFNRHKALYAQSVFKEDWSNAGPIAVIEEWFNFDNLPGTPNFLKNKACTITDEGKITPWQGDALSYDPFHGNKTSYLIGGKRSTAGLCGFAPGIPIIPIRIQGAELAIAAAIDHVTKNRLAKVINISKAHSLSGNDYPMPLGYIVSQAIKRATAAGVSVVCSAGNTGNNLDKDPNYNKYYREGEIIVGGIQSDGYEWGGSNYGSIIDIAAACDMNVFGYCQRPTGLEQVMMPAIGTSFAAPLVSATIAMMRHVSGDKLTDAKMIKEILIHSSVVGPGKNKDCFMGAKLSDTGTTPFSNTNHIARTRILDVYNALTIAKHMNERLWRVFNTDDITWTALENGWDHLVAENGRQTDSIYMIDPPLTTPRKLFASTYNQDGQRSAGYQIYWRGKLEYEMINGVVRTEYAAIDGSNRQLLYDTIGSEHTPTTGWAIPGGFAL